MRAAVIGAGPAGFYTAQALLNRFPSCIIDILEKLPVPFGLVRYGVAPDHPATKNVINQFTRLVNENRQRLNFYGNVPVGPNHKVTPQLLDQYYDLTIYATGATHPRNLSLPLPSRRVYSAHDFVFWLNSHPDAYDSANGPSIAHQLETDLTSAKDIAVVGVGNVALDVARILLRPVDDLQNTDISPAALDLLSQSKVSSVTLFGRKSPAQAAWTTAALREVVSKIPGIVTVCDHALIKHDLEQADLPRRKASALKLLAEKTVDLHWLQCSLQPSNLENSRLLQLEFLKSPTHFALNNRGVSMDLAAPSYDKKNDQVDCSRSMARQCTNHEAIFLSLGYVTDLVNTDTSVGWANGKATGIIGDNKWDAESVVSQLTVSNAFQSGRTYLDLPEWLSSSGTDAVTWEGWLRIDHEERQRALNSERFLSRVKIRSISEMLNIAHANAEQPHPRLSAKVIPIKG